MAGSSRPDFEPGKTRKTAYDWRDGWSVGLGAGQVMGGRARIARGACKICQATGSRSLASPLLGAGALRLRLPKFPETSEVCSKPSAARLGVRLLPASHVSLTTFAYPSASITVDRLAGYGIIFVLVPHDCLDKTIDLENGLISVEDTLQFPRPHSDRVWPVAAFGEM